MSVLIFLLTWNRPLYYLETPVLSSVAAKTSAQRPPQQSGWFQRGGASETQSQTFATGALAQKDSKAGQVPEKK